MQYKARIIIFSLAAVFAAVSAHAVSFQTQAEQDAVLKMMRVDERPGAQVPLDAAFTTKDGGKAVLRDYFKGTPVILSLNYYECPMLCPVTFANLAETMRDMDGLTPGRDFRIVTISINPDETVKDAKGRADETYKMLGGFPQPAAWWDFLFGDEKSIRAVTGATGFGYVRLGKTTFAHPAVLIVLTPEGRIARYLYGVKQEPKDLRLALLEASDGKIGASAALNKFLLYCFHYDPVGKKYAVMATNIMKLAGGFIVLVTAALLIVMWRSEKGRVNR